jgi:hypothetical protein
MPAANPARTSDDRATGSTANGDRSPSPANHAKGTKAARVQRPWSAIHWIQSLLMRPVKVKRIGLQLHVVLEEPGTTPQGSRPPGRGEALRLAHVALLDLLGRHDGARQLYPHLCHVEEALARHGSKALATTPIGVLQRAMVQLDNLEGNERSYDLMTLRLRVDESVKRRTPVNPRADALAIEVTDASHSQFDEAENQWTGRVPLDEPPEPARAGR